MESVIAEIIRVGGGKVFDLFTPAVVEGLVVTPNGEPVPNVVVYVGGQKTTTYASGKFLIKMRRGIYDIAIEHENKRYDNVEGINVGSGEKIEVTIHLPMLAFDAKSEDEASHIVSSSRETVLSGIKNEIEAQVSLDTETEDPSTGPTRFAKKYIENQPQSLQAIFYAIIEGLPSSVSYHGSRDETKYITIRQTKKPDWEIYVVARPRKKVLEVIFNAEADEVVTGLDEGKTFLQSIAEFKGPHLNSKHPTWGSYLNFDLSQNSPELHIEAARMAINWYLLESYRLYTEQ